MGEVEEFTNVDFGGLIVVMALSYFLGGFMAARTSAHVVVLTYTHVVLGAFFTVLWNFVLMYRLLDGSTPFVNSYDAISLVPIGIALLGAHVGLRGRRLQVADQAPH